MVSQKVPYLDGELQLEGFISFPDKAQGRKPAVLVASAWRGQDDFAREKAKALSELGYIGFALDMYGGGREVSNEEAPLMMAPLFLDRKLLQKRIRAAFDFLKMHPHVDPKKIGAIGFCFGGLCVIELLRSGVDLAGAVSFHAVVGNTLEKKKAKTAPLVKNIRGSLLILHGHDDPFVQVDEMRALLQELSEAKVDWQLHEYGGTMHAFTNPSANNPKGGVQFHPKSCSRAWKAMSTFFEEIF